MGPPPLINCFVTKFSEEKIMTPQNEQNLQVRKGKNLLVGLVAVLTAGCAGMVGMAIPAAVRPVEIQPGPDESANSVRIAPNGDVILERVEPKAHRPGPGEI